MEKDENTIQEIVPPISNANVRQDMPTKPTNPNQPRPSLFSKSLIFVIIIVIILAAGAGGYILALKKGQSSNNINSNTNIQSPSVTVSPTVPKTAAQNQLFSGHLQKLSQNLGLLLTYANSNDPAPTIVDPDVSYYSAGVYLTGKYAGYTRYVSVSQSGPGGPSAKIFASKDGKTFILDGEPVDLNSYKSDDYNNPVYSMDKTKVTAIDHLDSEHAAVIQLDTHYALSRDNIVSQVIPTGNKDKDGNQIDSYIIVTDFSGYPSLKSPLSSLTLLAQNSTQDIAYAELGSPTPTSQPSDPYIAGMTTVYALDSTGLAYSYTLANPLKAQDYPQQLSQYNKDMLAFQTKKTTVSPDYPKQPDLSLTKQDIQTDQSVYNSYNVALPGSCANGGDTLVTKNIQDSDLVKIGTSADGDIYVLKDKNHPLYQAQYQAKITSISDRSLSEFQSVNKTTANPPTYTEYVNQNPLIFIKDYWGRWVMLGEFDYQLEGGCGKPVIYLYPVKPTKISIQFLAPISLDTDIPTYHNGWNVLAQPDGILTDLQPRFTNCSVIDIKKFGSEYAGSACQNNSYPYLYWAGTSTNRPYPVITKGWIVSRTDVSSFMNKTLDTIGFSSQEKSDFLSYWIPQMMLHNSPYYRISFLQNSEMNEIAPMKVSPIPDHYFRYFLDYLPLDAKPSIQLQPENLTKIVRDGFTLIEWGGHLR